jgi:hypothetical protein
MTIKKGRCSVKNPEAEASCLLIAGIKRLHSDTMDMFRLNVHNIDGTAEGAQYNVILKSFLHHKVLQSIVHLRSFKKIEELGDGDMWKRTATALDEYLDVLPETVAQLVSIVYDILSRDQKNALLMNLVQPEVESNLRMLSGGRWQIERTEAALAKLVKEKL